MTALTWDPGTDDSGLGQDGTVLNEGHLQSLVDAINTIIHSGTNPTVSVAAAINELVAARGSLGTLDARLDVSLNEDGTLKTQASLVTNATAQSLLSTKNLLFDSLVQLWPDGDTSAPSGWTLAGAGASIARCGSGNTESSAPADTTRFKYAKHTIKITMAAAVTTLTRTVVPSGSFPTGLRNRKIAFAMRAKAGIASMASIKVDDGVTQTRGGVGGNGTYHDGNSSGGPGADGQEWLYCVHTFSGGATKLDIILEVAQSGSAYFSEGVLVISDLAPLDWFPERWGYFVIGQQQRGAATVANTLNEFRHNFEFPALMYQTRIAVKTAPASQSIILRPRKGTATSVYSSDANGPAVAAAATTGTKKPDGTYANRCFKQGDLFTWDVFQVGSGTVGEEISANFVFIVSLPELDLLGV